MKNTFKYILPLLLVAALPLSGKAQQNAGEVLKTLAASVKALGDYTVSFKLTAEGTVAVGEYTVSRDRYALNFGEIEVYSDGKTRYEINHDDEEILIDTLDPAARDILSNPTKAFDFADDEFTASSAGVTTVDGRACYVIHLAPKDKDSSIRNVELLVDRSTNLPYSISYAADGLSGYVVVQILRMASAGKVIDSLFKPDMNLYKGYEVIDFR